MIVEHSKAAFFVSLDALRFGAGVMNDSGDIIESNHYPNVTMATRSFLGLANDQPSQTQVASGHQATGGPI